MSGTGERTARRRLPANAHSPTASIGNEGRHHPLHRQGRSWQSAFALLRILAVDHAVNHDDRVGSPNEVSRSVLPGSLRPGDRVRLRPLPEILATLDENGSFEGVPFMPEMTAYAGRTMVVYRRLEKICDYFSEETRSRRMTNAVLLEDARCDGSSHGGCQAECRIFWKEAWLAHADDGGETYSDTPPVVPVELSTLLSKSTLRIDPELGEVFRCQATEAPRATTPVPEKAISQYVREVRVGNVSWWKLVQVGTGALSLKVARRLGLRGYLPLKVAGKDRIDGQKLGLKPGEWVRVRSPEEIGKTLNEHAAHRGLVFTHEMLAYCGRPFRVRNRVSRIIDERTGKMLDMKTECITLEGAVCTGYRSSGAWFCAREHYPLWREDWLERINPPVAT